MPKQASAMKKRAVRGSRSGRPIMALLDLLGRRWTLADRLGAARRPADLARAAHRLRRRLADGAADAAVRTARGRPGRTRCPATAIASPRLGRELMESFLPLHRFAERWSRRAVNEPHAQAAATVRLAPSACTILTRLPAGASGPATRQIVSSIRTVPVPSTIGFSSVNTRPISASVRLLRNGLLTLLAGGAARKMPPRRHGGGREHRKHQELRLPGRIDRKRQQPDQ